jgi:hypothetical protein
MNLSVVAKRNDEWIQIATIQRAGDQRDAANQDLTRIVKATVVDTNPEHQGGTLMIPRAKAKADARDEAKVYVPLRGKD